MSERRSQRSPAAVEEDTHGLEQISETDEKYLLQANRASKLKKKRLKTGYEAMMTDARQVPYVASGDIFTEANHRHRRQRAAAQVESVSVLRDEHGFDAVLRLEGG